MQIQSDNNRILTALTGFSVIAYIALRAIKLHSRIALMTKRGFLVTTVVLSALLILCQLLHKNPSSGRETEALPPVWFKRIPFLFLDTLALFGRHALMLLVINRVDHYFHTLYRDYGRLFPILHRLVIDLAIVELIVLLPLALFPRFLSRPVGGRRFDLFSGARSDLLFLETWSRLLTVCFYLAFAYYLFVRFLNTTMFQHQIKNDSFLTKASRLSLNLLILLAVYEIIKARKIAVSLLLLGILSTGVLHYIEGGHRRLIICICIMIVASANKNFKTIVRIYILESLLILAVMLIGIRTGAIENLIFYFGEDTSLPRTALGSLSPTDFSAHLLYLCLAWCILRPARRVWYHYLDYIAMIAALAVTWKINVARSNSAWLLLLIAGTFIHQTFPNILASLYRHATHLYKFILYLLSGSFLWFFIYCLSQCLTMTGQPILFESFFSRFMDVWSFRLRIYYGYVALKLNSTPITLLGFPYKEHGNGGTTVKPENYTFLDISYIRVLIVGGILVTIILLGIFTYLQIRNIRQRHLYLFFILLVVSLNCFVEHHIFDIAYDIYPLMAFSTVQFLFQSRQAPGRSRQPA